MEPNLFWSVWDGLRYMDYSGWFARAKPSLAVMLALADQAVVDAEWRAFPTSRHYSDIDACLLLGEYRPMRALGMLESLAHTAPKTAVRIVAQMAWRYMVDRRVGGTRRYHPRNRFWIRPEVWRVARGETPSRVAVTWAEKTSPVEPWRTGVSSLARSTGLAREVFSLAAQTTPGHGEINEVAAMCYPTTTKTEDRARHDLEFCGLVLQAMPTIDGQAIAKILAAAIARYQAA